jgi:hypothetical protein
VSIATHAVVIGLFVARAPVRDASAPSAPTEAPVSVAIVDPEPAPIEVIMLDPDPTPASAMPEAPKPTPAPATPATSRASAQAIHTGRSGTPGTELGRPEPGAGSAATPGPSATPHPGGKSKLHMRYGPEYVSSIEGMLDRAVDMPPGTPPAQPVPSGLLHDDAGGTKSSRGGEFDAKVARDGSVTITDGANVRLGARKGPPPDGPPVVLSFDVTDAMMRRHGQDPYASAKLKFLDRTRDERVEIGLAFKKDQLAHIAPMMRANIARAFVMFADPARQKRALFELWDDCAETGTEDLLEAGTVGRALVLGAIRKRFPAGSSDAYTADEIAALSRGRTSKAVFAPYE